MQPDAAAVGEGGIAAENAAADVEAVGGTIHCQSAAGTARCRVGIELHL